MSKKKLYLLLSIACATGYIWLTFTYFNNAPNNGVGICIFKHFTTIPCPSCGSTRSVISLLNGDILGSLLWNPFGLILVAIMVISPIWIFYDIIKHKETLFQSYTRAELFLKRKWVALPAILIVLANWVWNIYKGI